MKLYILVLTYLVSIPGISQTREATLYGNWAVDMDQTVLHMTPSEKQLYEGLPEEKRNSIATSFRERRFMFNKDYTVTLSFIVNKVRKDIKGTWTYSSDTVLSITVGTETHFYDVVWESASNLTLHYKTVASGAIISSLSLSRAN